MIDNDPVIITVRTDEDGNEISSFTINPNYKPKEEQPRYVNQQKEESFWDKICSFFVKHEIKPYVKINNLNKTDDKDTDLKSNPAIEIGIKGTF